MAYNNTYGIKATSQAQYNSSLNAFYKAGGCLDQIKRCERLSTAFDPTSQENNLTVDRICGAAYSYCTSYFTIPYLKTGHNFYDIAAINPVAFPPSFHIGYLNQPHVQKALGVPLNYSDADTAITLDFDYINGDYLRPGWTDDLSYLLESGIKVTMVYGDRDFACNWIGM